MVEEKISEKKSSRKIRKVIEKGGFVVLSINRKFPYGYLVSTSEQLGSIIRNTNQLPN